MKDSNKFDNVKTETEELREEFEAKVKEFIDNAITYCIKKEIPEFTISTWDRVYPHRYKGVYETYFDSTVRLQDIWSDSKYREFRGEDLLLKIIDEYKKNNLIINSKLYDDSFDHYYLDFDISGLLKNKEK